ncbi:hypothetical protein ACWDUD_18000 [Rhodococcus sp. NPDC003382]|uniref:hypothetical protein n=2 Tax=unclassified Rhodococcus (in: high G+C Gram-positive bacteria) TaxID=192944 RepID=UPI0035A81974
MSAKTKNSAALALGARVTIRSGSGHAAPEHGAIVADYGEAAALVADDLGRDWAPVRRWAVALDDGRLVFADDADLELETSPKGAGTAS